MPALFLDEIRNLLGVGQQQTSGTNAPAQTFAAPDNNNYAQPTLLPDVDPKMSPIMGEVRNQAQPSYSPQPAPVPKSMLDFTMDDWDVDPNKVAYVEAPENEVQIASEAFKGAVHIEQMEQELAQEAEAKGQPDPAKVDWLERVKGGMRDFFGDEEAMYSMALAFNSLRHRPDQAFAASLQKRLESARAKKAVPSIIKALAAKGVPEESLMALRHNPALLSKVAQSILTKGFADTPAEQQSFEALIADFSEEDKQKARRIKAGLDPRAGSMLTLSPDDLLVRSAATAEGAARGKDIVKREEDARKRAMALKGWSVALGGLESALAGTETGFFAGLLPAVFASQQAADMAVSRMTPILKDVFRGAGEGTFTNADQQLLNDMIPTRSTDPRVIAEALEEIDRLVRAKLNDPDFDIAANAKQVGATPAVPSAAPTQVAPEGVTASDYEREMKRRGLR